MAQTATGTSSADASAAAWLEFYSSLVDSLSWPTVVLILAFIFRTQIRSLLKKIDSVRIGDREVKFAREMEVATKQARMAGLSGPINRSREREVPDDVSQFLMQKVHSSGNDPWSTVIGSWSDVERELVSTCERLELPLMPSENYSFRETTRVLQSSGQLDEGVSKLLDQLRYLRNVAAHGAPFDISPSLGEAYEHICHEVILYLRNLGPGK